MIYYSRIWRDIMKYKNITIYYDKDESFEKAIIETKYGNLEIKSEEEFKSLINEYAKQNGLTVKELLAKKDLIKTVKDADTKKKSAYSTRDLTDEELGEIVFEIDEKEKKHKKKKSWIKRLIAGTAIIAILGTGTYYLDKNKKLFGGKIYAIFNPNKKVETLVDNKSNNNVQTNSNNNKTSNNGKITSVSSGNDNNSEYDQNMKGVINREENNNQVISQLSNGTVVELSNEQLLETLNDHSRIANSSIFEVSQYINDRGLSGTAYYYNFENLFNKDSLDYNTVKMFSDIRNSIISDVFKEKNKNWAKDGIESFYNLFIDLVFGNGSLKVIIDGQESVINFNDLSDMAKTTVLELGTAMLTIDYDYSYNDGNLSFEKEEILNNSVSMLEGELVPKLINKGYRK